ncbi:MAG TPA: hypothetical protein VF980_06710 [Thermoanaerobaculia bacterium]
MTEMPAVTYNSRRGSLVFFGVIQLAIGLLCILFFFGTLAIFLFSSFAPAGAAAPPFRTAIVGLLVYLLGGVLLISLGIGSMLARRWARDLSLIVAWMWLVIGVMTTIAMAAVVPRLMPDFPDQRTAGTVVLTCIAIALGVFGIVIPLLMVLFYRSENVRATCLAADPRTRWTERVPLPLLGLAFWTVMSAITMIGMTGYAVLPIRGTMITGPIAIAVYGAIGVLLLYVSWGLYRRSLLAWWIGVGYGVLVAAYCVLVFPNLDYRRLVNAMGMPKTPNAPDFTAIYQSPWFLAYLGFFWLLYLGYFVFVLRYFRREGETESVLR